MLQQVRTGTTGAKFLGTPSKLDLAESPVDTEQIFERADSMLRDENYVFTFPYSIRRLQQPWNYDPIEEKYWPKRFYSETLLHASDTPKDVKIVWEINRFKDLPALAQAALLCGETKYADEIQHRMLSWIEDNPVAKTINWSSALEIAIRLVSWTASIALLKQAGMNISAESPIGRSIWQQVQYLAQDLSVDKVVRSNHLIGEAAGLFVVASYWDYPEAKSHTALARRILEKEIIDQTYPDGSTKESSTWYHQFVTNFFQIVERVAAQNDQPMSGMFHDRLSKLESFLEALRPEVDSQNVNNLARIGDGDDGWAIYFEGDQAMWVDLVFGRSSRKHPSAALFPQGGYATLRSGRNFATMRAGPFGMGSEGFSSHAHDDCLSPILYIENIPVLVDPGTYVYNGSPAKRSEYRGADAHNGVEIGSLNRATQKFNFGWKSVRPDATLIEAASDESAVWCTASYGETRQSHEREIRLEQARFIVSDKFALRSKANVTLRFHFAPGWILLALSGNTATLALGDRRISFEITGAECDLSSLEYNYSASYLREEPAIMLIVLAEVSIEKIVSEFIMH